MALFRIAVVVHSRGKGGGNMVAASAYRAAERLHEPGLGPVTSAVHASAHIAGERLEEEHGRTWDYTAKGGVLHSELVLPDGAPDRFHDRQTMWVEAEKAERRRDAQTGREFVLTLPRELDAAENIELVRSFAQDSLASRGMAVDFAVHQVRASDGEPHIHAHVLCAMRRCDESGFTTKDRSWNDRALFAAVRHEWEQATNRELEHAGREERVDCRSLAEQHREAVDRNDFDRAAELDREPVPYLPRDTYFAEKSAPGSTELGRERTEVEAANVERAAAYEHVRELGPEAQQAFMEERSRSESFFDAFEAWAEVAHERMEHWLERTREAVAWGWDNLVAAMSPFSDFAIAERAAEQERTAQLDRMIDEALDEELGLAPEPQPDREPEREPDARGSDEWLDRIVDEALAEMGRDDRDHGRDRDQEHGMER